jgi:hypothetical protein
MIQPHGVADNLSRGAVAVVWVGWRLHPSSLAGRAPSGQSGVSVTMPGPHPFGSAYGTPFNRRPSVTPIKGCVISKR